MSTSSRLLDHYRTLGVVTNGSPLCITRLGSVTFAYSSYGRGFQVFRCDSLRVPIESQPLPLDIGVDHDIGEDEEGGRCEISHVSCAPQGGGKGGSSRGRHPTFVAAGKDIAMYERAECLGLLGKHPGIVVGLLVIGGTLISICKKGRLRTWDLCGPRERGQRTPLADMVLDKAIPLGWEPTVMCHPPTYINKVLLGSTTGQLGLWNVKTGQYVYEFKNHGVETGDAVTALKPSPALDVTAVGTCKGLIYLVHLKKDEVCVYTTRGVYTFPGASGILTFAPPRQGSPVKSMSFRTDADSASYPTLVSGGADGSIVLWNLKDRSVRHSFQCHTASSDSAWGEDVLELGGVATAIFFLQEPILLTSGVTDNSIKMWVLGDAAANGSNIHLLRSREGHSAPPRTIRFYSNFGTSAIDADASDPSSLCLLSAGEEGALRVFHIIRDSLATEMSQKLFRKHGNSLDKKFHGSLYRLSPLVSLAAVDTRGRDWSDILTCHEKDSNVYMWHFRRRTASIQISTLKRGFKRRGSDRAAVAEGDRFSDKEGNYVTAVAVSVCGSYGFVGSKGGHLYRYNMQSGAPSGTFPHSDGVRGAGQKYSIPRPGSVRIISRGEGDPRALKNGQRSIEQQQDTLNGAAEQPETAHSGRITAIAADILGEELLSCGLDGRVIWWNIKSQSKIAEAEILSPVSCATFAKDSGLLACACDDGAVRVFDSSSRKCVRHLGPCSLPPPSVNDLCFTPDCRRLVTATSTGSLHVWDLPTGRCVDWLLFSRPVTSVSYAPSGEFLVTTHAGSLGLSVWADRSYFEPVFLDRQCTEPIAMDVSGLGVEKGGEDEDMGIANSILQDGEEEVFLRDKRAIRGMMVREGSGEKAKQDELDSGDEEVGTVGGRGEDEVTITIPSIDLLLSCSASPPFKVVLSGLPRAYWSSLFNLEAIKERNRPVEPPQKPVGAPFFLPTLHSSSSNNKKGEAGDVELSSYPGNENWGDELWRDDADTSNDVTQRQEKAKGGYNRVTKRKVSAEQDVGPGTTPKEPESRILCSGGGGGSERPLNDSCHLAQLLTLDPPSDEEMLGGGGVPAGMVSSIEWSSRVLGYLKQSNYNTCTMFKTLGPSAIDVEMRLMAPYGIAEEAAYNEEIGKHGSTSVLKLALWFFVLALEHGGDFDIIQAYLHRFLDIHGGGLAKALSSSGTEDLSNVVATLIQVQRQHSKRLDRLFREDLGLLQFLGEDPTGRSASALPSGPL